LLIKVSPCIKIAKIVMSCQPLIGNADSPQDLYLAHFPCPVTHKAARCQLARPSSGFVASAGLFVILADGCYLGCQHCGPLVALQ
jgi:hypothetical protein